MTEPTLPKITATQPMNAAQSANATLIQINNLSLFYGQAKALKEISLNIRERVVTAFIGPSGCGKSTLLRCFNRMNDLLMACASRRHQDRRHDINSKDVDVIELRKRVGMVFQKSNPFPKSIYDNVAYGLRLQGTRNKSELDSAIEQSLRWSGLWEEVKDRLHSSALGLSGGQQQRLCIARAIAIKPKSF